MPRPISHNARSGGRSPADPHGPPLSTRMVPGRPQRVKTRRSSARTAAGGTRSQHPRGKNAGPQDGPAALVDDPEPTHPLAAPQADLLLGVHLPDVMRPRGSGRRRGRRGPAALRGGAEPGLSEPALQGALGGRPPAGRQPQEEADQAGSPGRVPPAQADGEVAHPIGGAGSRARATAVGRDQGGLAQAAEAGDQVLGGANGQAEGAGDGRRAFPAVVPAGDGPADGKGDGCRHGRSSRRGPTRTRASIPPSTAQNYMSHFRAKPYVGRHSTPLSFLPSGDPSPPAANTRSPL
jgi:hypothetical protein